MYKWGSANVGHWCRDGVPPAITFRIRLSLFPFFVKKNQQEIKYVDKQIVIRGVGRRVYDVVCYPGPVYSQADRHGRTKERTSSTEARGSAFWSRKLRLHRRHQSESWVAAPAMCVRRSTCSFPRSFAPIMYGMALYRHLGENCLLGRLDMGYP